MLHSRSEERGLIYSFPTYCKWVLSSLSAGHKLAGKQMESQHQDRLKWHKSIEGSRLLGQWGHLVLKTYKMCDLTWDTAMVQLSKTSNHKVAPRAQRTGSSREPTRTAKKKKDRSSQTATSLTFAELLWGLSSSRRAHTRSLHEKCRGGRRSPVVYKYFVPRTPLHPSETAGSEGRQKQR